MAVTNRTRKDSCEKARVLLLFVRHSRYRLTHVSRCTLGRPRPHTRTTLPLSKVWNISHQQGNQNLTWIAIQGHSRSCTSGSLKSRRGSIDILYKVSEQNMATEISENAEIYCRQPHCRTASPSRGTPANIRIYLIFLDNRIIGLHLCRWQYGSIFIQIFLVGSVKRIFSARVRIGRSRSISKVIDFGTKQKRVCNFLLVRHSNLGPILRRFRDSAGFCAHDPTRIPPWFWGCWSLDQIAHVGVIPSIYLKLIRREIIFEVFLEPV